MPYFFTTYMCIIYVYVYDILHYHGYFTDAALTIFRLSASSESTLLCFIFRYRSMFAKVDFNVKKIMLRTDLNSVDRTEYSTYIYTVRALHISDNYHTHYRMLSSAQQF